MRCDFGVKGDRMNGRIRMGARLAVVFFVLLITAPSLMAASEGPVYLNSIEGNIEYIPAVSQKVTRAKPNKPVMEGDTVAVNGPGNAEIFVRDGSVIRISEGSRLKVLAIERTAIQFFLESGRAYVKCAGLNGHPLFLNTPSAQLDGYDRSVFRADITPTGDTEVSVYSGQLYIAQPRGKMTMIAGTRLIMKKDGGTPVYTTNRPADTWDAWNRKKDGTDPGMANPQPGTTGNVNPAPQTEPPAALYPPVPMVVDPGYVYVAPAPYWWYPYYYPWGYRPYPWRWSGPYYRGWGPRPWYGGYRGRPYGPGHYRGRR
jgi:hypothetical protein